MYQRTLVAVRADPPESVARLFEPYWRAAHSSARGGLGLGLYICSQIVEGHGGSLEVTSAADGTTTFTARIPDASP